MESRSGNRGSGILMTERREIEERHKKRIRNPNFGGRSNWDTYEAVNIIESDESLHRNWESWSANFNRKLRDGTFNEAKAKEALRKYLLKEVKKRDEEYVPAYVKEDGTYVNGFCRKVTARDREQDRMNLNRKGRR